MIETCVKEGVETYMVSKILVTKVKVPKSVTHEELSKEFKEMLVGLTLGDAYLRRRHNGGTYVCIKQSIKNKAYVIHLYE